VADGVVAGGPERVAARLRAYADLGAEWAILGPLDAPDPENATILGELVAPLVRAV
jgi:alkanesulfonate monooxygenase SsuD/methylene tetrahydromethanopterin reductase-like flavin-dependent oxidoreductase (luciferase family)